MTDKMIEAAGTGPVRIQRRRVKGWRLPPNTAAVSRPTRFGNPFSVREIKGADIVAWAVHHGDTQIDIFADRRAAAAEAARLYRAGLKPQNIRAIRRVLAGKNLACWCRLDMPCHADVLLEIANAPVCEEVADV